MILVNLCPHDIHLSANGVLTTIPRSGQEARVDSEPSKEVRWAHGVPVPIYGPPVWGEITGLPEPQEGVIFIVSLQVVQRLQFLGVVRIDVVSPGTGPKDGAVREPKTFPDGSPNSKAGQIVAVTRLIASA